MIRKLVITSMLTCILVGCAHTYSVRMVHGLQTSLPVMEVQNAVDASLAPKGFQRMEKPYPFESQNGAVHVAWWRNPGKRNFWIPTGVDVTEVKSRDEIILYLYGDAHFTRPLAKELEKTLQEHLPGYPVKVKVDTMYGFSWAK